MARRHVHIDDHTFKLFEAAKETHKVSLGYLVNRGIRLAISELEGHVGLRFVTEKTYGPEVVARVVNLPEPKKPPSTDNIPTLSEDGAVWFGLNEMCDALGVPLDEVKLQLDDEDTLIRGATFYVASLGVNTACAVAAANGVDGEDINAIQEWAERLSA